MLGLHVTHLVIVGDHFVEHGSVLCVGLRVILAQNGVVSDDVLFFDHRHGLHSEVTIHIWFVGNVRLLELASKVRRGCLDRLTLAVGPGRL